MCKYGCDRQFILASVELGGYELQRAKNRARRRMHTAKRALVEILRMTEQIDRRGFDRAQDRLDENHELSWIGMYYPHVDIANA